MSWKILCMDCDYAKTLSEEERKNLKKCPNCNSENIQIYDDKKGAGAHCAGSINPSAFK